MGKGEAVMSGQPVGLFFAQRPDLGPAVFRVWVQTAFEITGIDDMDQKFWVSAIVGEGVSLMHWKQISPV